ncbi:MAG TPA: AAA family ATPase, partial [Polyangiales bacterium]|nr:AAA family ATPase [Polyangiales bacterium]
MVALFQSHREIAELCNGNGFTEQSLVAALNAAPEEPASGVDLAVERAKKLATTAGSAQPKALHLLLSLVREARSAASLGLQSTGLSPEKLATAAREALTEPPLEPSLPTEPPAATRRTEHRWGRTREPRLDRFRSFALSKETESKLARTRTEQVDVVQARTSEPAREASPTQTGDAKPAPEQLTLTPQPRTSGKTSRARSARAGRQKAPAPEIEVNWTLDEQRFPLLSSLARNLTGLAASGHIDPVIGRDADIERLLDVLARRRGNNPLLVGAPGVGKTAVVEGLALALVQQARRGQTHGKREPFILLEVAASSLLAGTGVRGALSERIQTLRKEVAESGRVLLFIDEIHGVLGGVEGDGLGSELKSALARGELPVIGATTDAEYRRIFERDAALARRFTRIEVSEPSRADTLHILKGIVPQYSSHHAVKYAPDALEAAIDLSVRYMPLRQLPDKAIGLLDQAAARVRRSGDSLVDRVAIARVVSELVQVPVERLLMEDREALLALEEQLSARVVGQARAIDAISHALRRSAAGFRGQRPLGTFLFAGPTGVGKT